MSLSSGWAKCRLIITSSNYVINLTIVLSVSVLSHFSVPCTTAPSRLVLFAPLRTFSLRWFCVWQMATNQQQQQQKTMGFGHGPRRSDSLLKSVLQRFNVCPLLLVQRMDKGSSRPVYKFVFSCPGNTQALVKE